MHQDLDLCYGQRAAVLSGERRHQRLATALFQNVRQLRLRHDSSKEWIVERRRRPQRAIGAVTPGAVPLVQGAEFQNLVCGYRPVGGVGSAGKVAPRDQYRNEYDEALGQAGKGARYAVSSICDHHVNHRDCHGSHTFSCFLS